MSILTFVISILRNGLQKIQSKLAFDDWTAYSQFDTNQGLGRVASLASILGILWGFHVACALGILIFIFLLRQQQGGEGGECHNHNSNSGILLSNLNTTCSLFESILQWKSTHSTTTTILLLFYGLRWCVYVVLVCTFHGLEFFITALYNPSVTSADSFLINHSLMYTAAMLLTWFEFAIRCGWLFWNRQGSSSSSSYSTTTVGGSLYYTMITFVVGLVLVIPAQALRSWAMITCGESFNHLIQPNKKDNHVLISHGIYKYLRHPSYVGFFYWVLATQLVLGNLVCAGVFALATWRFFQRRIIYEEQVLLQHFPNQYPSYRASTYIGIPLLARFTQPP